MRFQRGSTRLRLGAFALVLVSKPLTAQQAASFNENLVFLDASHGGTDAGAHLGGSVDEKDVTLAFAGRLKTALTAKGFTVLLSRDGDTTVPPEQRAGLANHARPLACLLLHASATGTGTALAVSTLPPEAESRISQPWAAAQAPYITQSLSLRDALAAALGTGKSKAVPLRASTPPVDSLTCAAVTVELLGSTDAGAQQQATDALVQALVAWKAQAAPPRTPPSGGTP